MNKLISLFVLAALVGFISCDSGIPEGTIVPDPINIDPPENGQGNDNSTMTVSVDGTTLVVNGNEYPRDPNVTIKGSVVSNGKRDYVAGEIMVRFYTGIEAKVAATLAALGLEVRHTHNGYTKFFIVGVTELFEEQWVAALDDLGITASVNGISSLDIN